MNKKLFAALTGASLLFAGCSSTSSTASSTADAGKTSHTAYVDHDGNEISATVTKKDGKITAVSIDEATEDGKTKKELGEEYSMKSASGIGKEWNEQIEFLENYIVEHGADSVKLDADGYAEDEDVRSGVTINLSKIMEAVDEAAAE